MTTAEGKIVDLLHRLAQKRFLRNLTSRLDIQNPIDIIHLHNRHNGLQVSAEDISINDISADSDDTAVLERIQRAYILSKEHQPGTGPYSVSGLWYEILEKKYRPLLDSAGGDLESLQGYLKNMFRTGTYGLSASGVVPDPKDEKEIEKYLDRYSDNLLNLALYCDIPYVRKMMDSEYILVDAKVRPSTLWGDICKYLEITPDYPIIGNPFGIVMETTSGMEIVPFAAMRHLYIACRISALLSPFSEKRFMEIGGGFGGVIYFASKLIKDPISIWSIDLPEINIISSYYLLKSLPGEKIILFGEKDTNDPGNIYILPNWELKDFQRNTIDLACNCDSMPEMPAGTAIEYLKRIGEISKYFYSYNQDCGIRNQTRLSQIDCKSAGLECISHAIAWMRHGYFERVFRSTLNQ